jgi:hypothetical protein
MKFGSEGLTTLYVTPPDIKEPNSSSRKRGPDGKVCITCCYTENYNCVERNGESRRHVYGVSNVRAPAAPIQIRNAKMAP